MGGETLNKKVLVVAIIMSLIVVASFGLFLESSERKQIKYSYIYEIKVETNNTNNYFLLLPFPIINNSHYSKRTLMNITFIEGNGVFNIENSSKGIALNISSSGSFIIQIKSEDKYEANSLSLKDNNTHSVWVYSSSDAILSLEIYFENIESICYYNGLGQQKWVSGGGPSYYILSRNVIEGWQPIELQGGEMVIN